MDCPRCGTRMSGGVCPECGFPVNTVKGMKVKRAKRKIGYRR